MKKILVVDDIKEIRMLVVATLGDEEYTLFEAHDATEALQLCSKEIPDLIIMDVNMPGKINGIRATKMLKSNKETSHCHVIMLSGTKNSTEIDEAMKAGADGFLQKPFSPLELIEKVEHVLGIG
jgi:CheY-like chemotaxis protein